MDSTLAGVAYPQLYPQSHNPRVSLDLALPNEVTPFVSKSAVAQARQRDGDAPLAWLFEQTAGAWCQRDADAHAFKGLSLWAMDGTTLRTADSPANREHFGAQVYASGKLARLPAGANHYARCDFDASGGEHRLRPL